VIPAHVEGGKPGWVEASRELCQALWSAVLFGGRAGERDASGPGPDRLGARGGCFCVGRPEGQERGATGSENEGPAGAGKGPEDVTGMVTYRNLNPLFRIRIAILARAIIGLLGCGIGSKQLGIGPLLALDVVWPTETSQTDINYFQLIFELSGGPFWGDAGPAGRRQTGVGGSQPGSSVEGCGALSGVPGWKRDGWERRCEWARAGGGAGGREVSFYVGGTKAPGSASWARVRGMFLFRPGRGS